MGKEPRGRYDEADEPADPARPEEEARIEEELHGGDEQKQRQPVGAKPQEPDQDVGQVGPEDAADVGDLRRRGLVVGERRVRRGIGDHGQEQKDRQGEEDHPRDFPRPPLQWFAISHVFSLRHVRFIQPVPGTDYSLALPSREIRARGFLRRPAPVSGPFQASGDSSARRRRRRPG